MELTMKWSSEMNNGRGLSPLTTFLFSISFHHFAVDKMNVCSSILIQTLIGRESFFLQDSAVRVPEGKCFRREFSLRGKQRVSTTYQNSFSGEKIFLFEFFKRFSGEYFSNNILRNLIEKGINKTRLTCGFTVA